MEAMNGVILKTTGLSFVSGVRDLESRVVVGRL